VDEAMNDAEMEDMENFEDIIIGNRRPRHQTNWYYHHDALSQTQYAYQIQLENEFFYHFDLIKKLKCFSTFLLTLLTLVRRNGNSNIISSRIRRALLMITAVIIYHKSKACSIQREFDNLLNIYSSDRIAAPFLEKKHSI
jgi:hypothetical protein